MGINKDESNIHLPLIKATAILLLSKFWDPAILDPKKGNQDISFMLVRIIIIIICVEFDIVDNEPSESQQR